MIIGSCEVMLNKNNEQQTWLINEVTFNINWIKLYYKCSKIIMHAVAKFAHYLIILIIN